MRPLRLKLSITPGVRIEDAARELCRLANLLDVECSANLNQYVMTASPGQEAHELIAAFWLFHERAPNTYTYQKAEPWE